MAQYANDPKEREHLERLSSSANKHEYLRYIVEEGRNLRQVLEEHKSVRVMPDADQEMESSEHAKFLTVGDLLELLPRLQCRYYSISSSSKKHSTHVHVTAAIARYRTPLGREDFGVATGYLNRICHSPAYAACKRTPGAKPAESMPFGPGDRVPIFLRTSTFKLPKNLQKPVVMIGPGTGVAPFRGFIQERTMISRERIRLLKESGRFAPIQTSNAAGHLEEMSLPGGLHIQRVDLEAHGVGSVVGETVLFYGCRNRDADFLYREEWRAEYFGPSTNPDEFGTGLTELVCAFSREQPGAKTYVQHRVRERKKKVWDLLHRQEGSLYVCGDAKNMARDVHRTVVELAMDADLGKMSEPEATAYVKKLRETGRYLEDVWS